MLLWLDASLALVVLLPMPVLALFAWRFAGQVHPRARFNLPRALVVGGVAGVVSGWAFGRWMAQAGFFPIIAGLVGSDSAAVGMALHFAIATVIGASFGALFQGDLRGPGSSLGWGLAYGVP